MEDYGYTIEFSIPGSDEFAMLRESVGWVSQPSTILTRSLRSSLFCVSVRHNSRLIAMARVSGDGAMYFYIQDVIVLPGFQRQGLGKKLMFHVEDYLRKCAPENAFIGLFSARGKEPFYEKYNYTRVPEHQWGNAMYKFAKKGKNRCSPPYQMAETKHHLTAAKFSGQKS